MDTGHSAIIEPVRRLEVFNRRRAAADMAPARASIWIARRWQTGSAMPPGTCARCMSAS